ncbi:MAG: hypothetical protein WC477_02305 [Patescibacteria group bacterium]
MQQTETRTQKTLVWGQVAPTLLLLQSGVDETKNKSDEIGQKCVVQTETRDNIEEGAKEKAKEEQERTKIKKRLFLEVYGRALGSISRSCRAIEIARSTYYEWIENDLEFKKEVDMTAFMVRDDVDGYLLDLIHEKHHPASIRYWLSRRHPKYRPPYRPRRADIVALQKGSAITYV